MRRTVFGILCLLFSCLPAAADEWLRALMLFDAGRYQEALVLLTPIAEGGSLEAQEIIYGMYTYGYGVAVDHEVAFGWAQRGAEAGDPRSQDALGHHYLDGTGVEADAAKAVHWFRLAAQQGYPPAIYNLGMLTMSGQGIKADQEEAWRLIQRAAELEDAEALYVIAGFALQNATTTRDIDTGLNYLTRAARQGQRQASALLGVIMEDFPEDPDHLMKSAFHYRMAIAAGCDDIDDEAANAVARLSPSELKALEDNLAIWQPDTDPRDEKPEPSHCLAN